MNDAQLLHAMQTAHSQRTARATVDNSRHDRSHPTGPRGRGGWMFENEAGEHVFTHSGTFAEARKAALAWARANSVDVLYTCP